MSAGPPSWRGPAVGVLAPLPRRPAGGPRRDAVAAVARERLAGVAADLEAEGVEGGEREKAESEDATM